MHHQMLSNAHKDIFAIFLVLWGKHAPISHRKRQRGKSVVFLSKPHGIDLNGR